jgi:hypothetical protein
MLDWLSYNIYGIPYWSFALIGAMTLFAYWAGKKWKRRR